MQGQFTRALGMGNNNFYSRWHIIIRLDWIASLIFLMLCECSKEPGNEVTKQWSPGNCDPWMLHLC